jgi:hypothetical protein
MRCATTHTTHSYAAAKTAHTHLQIQDAPTSAEDLDAIIAEMELDLPGHGGEGEAPGLQIHSGLQLDAAQDYVDGMGGKKVCGGSMMKHLWQTSKNKYDVSTKVLSSSDLHHHGRMVYHASQPQLDHHLREVRESKGQAASVKFAADRAAGTTYIGIVNATLHVTKNRRTIARCALDASAGCPTPFKNPSLHANLMWRLCCNASAMVAWRGEFQSRVLPEKFAQLVHTECHP